MPNQQSIIELLLRINETDVKRFLSRSKAEIDAMEARIRTGPRGGTNPSGQARRAAAARPELIQIAAAAQAAGRLAAVKGLPDTQVKALGALRTRILGLAKQFGATEDVLKVLRSEIATAATGLHKNAVKGGLTSRPKILTPGQVAAMQALGQDPFGDETPAQKEAKALAKRKESERLNRAYRVARGLDPAPIPRGAIPKPAFDLEQRERISNLLQRASAVVRPREVEAAALSAQRRANLAVRAAGSAGIDRDEIARQKVIADAALANKKRAEASRRADEQATATRQANLDKLRAQSARKAATEAATEQTSTEREVARRARVATGLAPRAGPPVPPGLDPDAYLRQYASVQQQRLSALRAKLHGDQRELQLQARTALAQRQVLQAENLHARKAYEAAVAAGLAPRGTLTQRFQAGIASGGGGPYRPPTDFRQFGQLAKGSLLTTARFAASGALLYGGYSAIKGSIKDSAELEVQLGILEAQFTALGKAGQLEDVPEALKAAKREIFDIARETGTATAQLAGLGVQFVGAFGPEFGFVAERIAAKIAVIGDLDPGEVFNDLVAGAKAFAIVGKDATQTQAYEAQIEALKRLADISTAVRNVTGVQQKELLDFLGRVGPIAKTAGLSLEEVTAAGAALLQGSGVAGAGLGEQFSRILTDFSTNSVTIAQIVGASEDIRKKIDETREGGFAAFSVDLVGGDASTILDLAKAFGQLDEAQQRVIIQQLAGRREGATFATLLQNAATAAKAQAAALDSTGTAQAEFEKRQESLRLQLSRLGVQFEQFGLTLFTSGLGEGIKGLVGAAGVLLEVLKGILGILRDFNTLTFGYGGELILAYAAARGLLLTLTAIRGLGLLSGAGAGAAAAGSLFAGGAGVNVGQQKIGQTAAGGASTRLAALGLTKFNIALTGATLVAIAYAREQGRVANAAGALEERLKEASDVEVDRVAAGRSSNFSKFQFGLFGVRSPEQVAQAERRRRDAIESDLPPRVREATGGVFGETSQEERNRLTTKFGERLRSISGDQYEDIFNSDLYLEFRDKFSRGKFDEASDQLGKALDEGQKGAVEIARAYLQSIPEAFPAAGKRLADAVRAAVTSAGIADTVAAVDSGEIAKSLSDLKSEYASGQLDFPTYLKLLEQQRDELVTAINGQQGVVGPIIDELEATRSQIADALSTQTTRSYDYQVDLQGLSGGDPAKELEIRLKQLKDPRLTNRKERQDVVKQVLDLQAQILQQTAAVADTTAEQVNILRNGLAIPKEARFETLRAGIAEIDPQWTAFLTAQFGSIEAAGGFIDAIVNLALEKGLGIATAARQYIENLLAASAARLADLTSKLALVRNSFEEALNIQLGIYLEKANQEKLAADLAGLPGLPDFTVPGFVTDEYGATKAGLEKDKADNEAKARALAELDVAAARAAGDPVALASIAIRRAEVNKRFAVEESEKLAALAELINAQKAFSDAVADIGAAQGEYALALRGGDAVGTAFTEIMAAKQALEVARGAAAKLRAQAQLVTAERALQEAFADIGIAQLELAQAFADAAGDSVKSAEIALQAAQANLAKVRASSPNDEAALLNAQAGIVAAQANVRDNKLSTQQKAIDVALQLEQITTQQAIAQLQALLQIPELTLDQTNDILLKIKSLQDDLGSDFRFNLPTSLYLPTAYETRRAVQGGAGYNDNRQINVTVNAETNADPNAIARTIVQVIGEPNRTGATGRSY